MKLKVTLLTVAIMKLKAAANVDILDARIMGNAPGKWVKSTWNVSLKVYVKPYLDSVFTGVCLCFKLLYQLY